MTCPTRPAESYVEQQYVVASSQCFILNAYRTTPAIRAALRDVLTHSTLPRATPGGVRLADRGYLRSVRHTPQGVVIRIRRAVEEQQNQRHPVRTEGTRTYRYLVPQRVAGKDLAPGDLVYLASDGTTVISLDREG